MSQRDDLIASGRLKPLGTWVEPRIDKPTLELDDRARVMAAKRLRVPEPEPKWIAWRGDDT
jgi:hypothetical protein